MDGNSDAAATLLVAERLVAKATAIQKVLRGYPEADRIFTGLLLQLVQDLNLIKKLASLRESLDPDPTASLSICSALAQCEKALAALIAIALPLMKGGLRKAKLALKMMSKIVVDNEDTFQVVQTQLREAVQALHMVISSISIDIQ